MKKYFPLFIILALACAPALFADNDNDVNHHRMDQKHLRFANCGSIRAGEAVNGSNPNSNGPGSENNCNHHHHFFFAQHTHTMGNFNPMGAGR